MKTSVRCGVATLIISILGMVGIYSVSVGVIYKMIASFIFGVLVGGGYIDLTWRERR